MTDYADFMPGLPPLSGIRRGGGIGRRTGLKNQRRLPLGEQFGPVAGFLIPWVPRIALEPPKIVQYISSETGLCGSCGAPEGTALVPVGSTDMMADPEVAALHGELPPKAQALIRGYVETLTLDAGAEAVGVT